VLLPFTLVTERNRIQNEELVAEVEQIKKTYANDPILQKEQFRKVLKRRKVQPWAKAIVLGIQLLVLVLLYQVFLRGITGEKILRILYQSVDFPGVINTQFLGFDLAERYNYLWSGAVGIFLIVEIYLDFKRSKRVPEKKDLLYLLAFPAFCFILLWVLPMVKSLFVLTSMVFSVIVAQFSKILFRSKSGEKESH
jgi:membrane protein insertase Oxa1/YidC/SpoIIIJ